MSSPIELVFNSGAGYSDKIEANIINEARDISYKISIGDITVFLKSSARPEWDVDSPYVLFLQGSEREFDNEQVEIPRKYLKYILFAIYQYNLQFNVENTWIDRYKFKCNHCGCIKSVKQFQQKNFEYCLDCIDKLKVCSNCGRLGASHQFGDEYFCSSCVCIDSYCQVCDTEHSITRELFLSCNGNYHGTPISVMCCSSCYGTQIKLGIEHHYQYVPETFNFLDFDFKSKEYTHYTSPLNNKLYMGMEIEAHFNTKKHINIVLGKILQLNKDTSIYKDKRRVVDVLYAKHDGTVRDPGSEIVTHPMTLNMFRSLQWSYVFDNIIKPTSYGIGGHVHINKNAFVSPLHVYKFCKFIRTNVQYIEWIAERMLQNDWCKASSSNGKVVTMAKTFKDNLNRHRYEMINFTPFTIELRFFWSPWNTGMLLKNVEFVDALYNYSRDTKLHFSYSEFEDYVSKHAIEYPYLYNFILKRSAQAVFKTNKEQINIPFASTAPPPAADIIEESDDDAPCVIAYCGWCDEPIDEDSYEQEHDRYYHVYCYSDMVEDRETEIPGRF